jgi:hypothetical protein
LDLPSSSLSLFPLSPLLRTISTGFILLFSYMDTKYIHNIHPHFPFPCAHPPPTGPNSWKRPIFPSCLSFAFFLKRKTEKGGGNLFYPRREKVDCTGKKT